MGGGVGGSAVAFDCGTPWAFYLTFYTVHSVLSVSIFRVIREKWERNVLKANNVSHITRKPYKVCNQLRLKTACSADETS